jgi:hypothetical protein
MKHHDHDGHDGHNGHDDHDGHNGHDQKIDLTALDPSRDRARWAELVDTITTRVAQARRPSVTRQLLVWARPTLALAAAVALVVWGSALLGARESEAEAAPADLLARWAQNDEVPAATQILDVLGDTNGSE